MEETIRILNRNLLIFNGIMNIRKFILKPRIPSYRCIVFDLRKTSRSMPDKETTLVIKWKSNIVKEWTLHLDNKFPISTDRDLDNNSHINALDFKVWPSSCLLPAFEF